jgi:hypothetical protein
MWLRLLLAERMLLGRLCLQLELQLVLKLLLGHLL